MQLLDGRPVYAATDLVGFLACTHLTDLERAALGGLTRRPERVDAELDAIAERGKQHEQDYLDGLVATGRTVVSLDEKRPDGEARGDFYRRKAAETVAAISRGDDVIFQACFFDGTWLGFADFLLRVEDTAAPLGWSYEVADTKLAHHVKASALLQICVYNELLEAIQGRYPEHMHVALGGRERETKHFRTADYRAYFRMVKAAFLAAAGAPLPVDAALYPPPAPSYPEPVEHCEVCRWDEVCGPRRRTDDHLSLVAGIASRTRSELTERGTSTRRALAVLPLPLAPRLEHTSPEALLRVREQARIQVEGEAQGRVIHELLAPIRLPDGTLDPSKGLLALPPPSPGDLFLDLEGDPFAGEDGIDYLFGLLEPGKSDAAGEPLFHAYWSRDADGVVTEAAEKRAFEWTIDHITKALEADPDLHIYHYAAYEPAHLGKLMGRHDTRQVEVDALFRGDRLIDLFQVVRQGLRASVESYSIKKLEPLYDFQRAVGLRDAGSSIEVFERWLRMGGQGGVGEDLLADIQAYNRDDVLSTWRLRDWLEKQRAELGRQLGESLPRPEVKTGDADQELAGWLAQVEAVAGPLRERVPPDERERPWTEEERGTRLLADLLGWHRREQKPDWWRIFHQLQDLTDEERLDEKEPLALLELLGPEDDSGRRFRYRFPEQDFALEPGRGGTDPATGGNLTVVSIDDVTNEIVLGFPGTREVVHPRSLVAKNVVPTKAQEERLLDIGRWVREHDIGAPGPFGAARDLLMRQPPRIAGHALGAPLHVAPEAIRDAALRHVVGLDHTTLAIQGPPGSGKTWCGARMILELVAAGRKVGVTANSHKVIGKLLDEVLKAAAEPGRTVGAVRVGQKPGEGEEPTCADAISLKEAKHVRRAFDNGEMDVVGGTPWLWANEQLLDSVDVLFIDEAGQFSLANAVAVSTAADSLVLLGDPQQLDQPLKGSHPPGAEHSALGHLLGNHAVMPDHLGLFMERTWRLHPDICDYTSEVFYESKLLPQDGNERQRLAGRAPTDGEGIRFMAVEHEASRNDTDSQEEAEAIAAMIADLLGGAEWTDREGVPRSIGPADILVITPYNAQRKRIDRALAARGERAAQVAVGTVDKFQGQEAPISIYSMATSRPEDAPRGMEFLYSLNRLNVATSRARCLTLVVASPALVNVRARSPRQMELANAFCRLVEVADR